MSRALAQTSPAFEQRISPEALKLLRQAEQLAGKDALHFPAIAKGYYWARSMEDAERLLDRALASDRLAVGSMALRVAQEYKGRVLLRRGKEERAEALLKQAAAGLEEANERDPSLYYGCPYQALGELYYARQQPTAAMRALQKAADLEQDNSRSQFGAARAAVEIGDLPSASRYFLRALALCEAPWQGKVYQAWVETLVLLRRKVRAGMSPYDPVEVRLHFAAHLVGQPLVLWARQGAARLLGLSDARGQGRSLAGASMARRAEVATAAVVTELLSNDAALTLGEAAGGVVRRFMGEQAAPAEPGPDQRESNVRLAVGQAVEEFLDNEFSMAADVAGDLLALRGGQVPAAQRQTLLAVRGYTLLVNKAYTRAEKIFGQLDGSARARDFAGVGRGHLAIVRQDYASATRLLAPMVATGDAHLRDLGPGAEVTPDFWLAYRMACLGMAWATANQNDNEAAMTHYQRILRHRPADLFALLGMGNALTAARQMDRAELLFRAVLARDPRNAFAHAEMGLLHYNRGDDAAALNAFSMALRQDKERYTCPYEGMGLVYLRQGKLKKAQRNFERAISIAPNIEYKKYNGLAKIHIREGNYAAARRLLRKSLKNYPHDPEARRLLASLPAPQ